MPPASSSAACRFAPGRVRAQAGAVPDSACVFSAAGDCAAAAGTFPRERLHLLRACRRRRALRPGTGRRPCRRRGRPPGRARPTSPMHPPAAGRSLAQRPPLRPPGRARRARVKRPRAVPHPAPLPAPAAPRPRLPASTAPGLPPFRRHPPRCAARGWRGAAGRRPPPRCGPRAARPVPPAPRAPPSRPAPRRAASVRSRASPPA